MSKIKALPLSLLDYSMSLKIMAQVLAVGVVKLGQAVDALL